MSTRDVTGEISRYLCAQPIGDEVGNPLLFWKNRSAEFPVLCMVARKYLTDWPHPLQLKICFPHLDWSWMESDLDCSHLD